MSMLYDECERGAGSRSLAWAMDSTHKECGANGTANANELDVPRLEHTVCAIVLRDVGHALARAGQGRSWGRICRASRLFLVRAIDRRWLAVCRWSCCHGVGCSGRPNDLLPQMW
jgi:hypothetical protein